MEALIRNEAPVDKRSGFGRQDGAILIKRIHISERPELRAVEVGEQKSRDEAAPIGMCMLSAAIGNAQDQPFDLGCKRQSGFIARTARVARPAKGLPDSPGEKATEHSGGA